MRLLKNKGWIHTAHLRRKAQGLHLVLGLYYAMKLTLDMEFILKKNTSNPVSGR